MIFRIRAGEVVSSLQLYAASFDKGLRLSLDYAGCSTKRFNVRSVISAKAVA